MTDKEWRAIDEKIRDVAVRSYMDNYRVYIKGRDDEVELFKHYLKVDYPESYKPRLTDEEIKTVILCINELQNHRYKNNRKWILIALAAVLVFGILLFFYNFL